MILLALALAAQGHWTGPHTVEYQGPGYFCGGGYAIHLLSGDRALVLPQSASAGVQAVRVILSGRNVNVWSGATREPGSVVIRYGDTAVTEQRDGTGVGYTVSDQTGFALRLTSDAFRGFSRDSWFFTNANFSSAAENRVRCLAAVSY